MKKSRLIIWFIVLASSAGCSTPENQKVEVRENMTYDLIKYILSDSTDAFFKEPFFIAEKPMQYPPLMNGFRSEKLFLLDLFNENDTLNLDSQFRKRKEFLIDSSKISTIELFPKDFFEKYGNTDSIWNIIDRDYGGGFYSIGMPFFSSDNNLVYIRINYMCGWLCGGGHSRLYRYNNGQWELLDKFDFWIS